MKSSGGLYVQFSEGVMPATGSWEVVIGTEVPEQRKIGGVTRLQIGVCYEKIKINLG